MQTYRRRRVDEAGVREVMADAGLFQQNGSEDHVR